MKIKQAPANRYVYYLTPKGFAEKSRLTAPICPTPSTFIDALANPVHVRFNSARRRGGQA